jgi:hypothetical protein
MKEKTPLKIGCMQAATSHEQQIRGFDFLLTTNNRKKIKNQFKLNHCAEKKSSDGSMIN